MGYLMTASTMIQASVAMTTLPAKTSGKNIAQLRLRQGAVEGSAGPTFTGLVFEGRGQAERIMGTAIARR
jgi:hypothetical protein